MTRFNPSPESEDLLTRAEVAARFRVSAQTVRRWGKAGLLEWIVTPGGHPRYPAADIAALVARGGLR